MNALEWIAARRKAIAGYLVPAIVSLGAALLPDSAGGSAVTAQEWVALAVAGLSCGTVVYAVRNGPKPAAS